MTERRRDIGAAAGIFALNAYIALNLFWTDYSSRMNSIEGAYVGLTRYIAQNGLSLGWFPLWYGGIPFQNTYPPLLHALSALVMVVFGISPGLAHHIVGATFYCLGPVFLYFLAARLSGSWKVALAASFLYTLFCPSTVMTAGLSTWAPSSGDPSRFLSLIKFGDSPHIAALALVPLALLAIDRALERTSATRVFLAALLTASVVLTNWLGASALTMAIVSYLLGILIQRRGLREIWITFWIGVFAYALALPWIPPSTIDRIRYNAQNVVGDFPLTSKHIYYALGIVTMLGASFFVLRWLRASVFTGFSIFYSLLSLTLLLSWEKLDIALLPQPNRYHLEVDMGVCLAATCLGAMLLSRIPWKHVGTATVIAAVVLGFYQGKRARRSARYEVSSIDITGTIEYQQAVWLQQHLPNERVFMTGSSQFWLDAFADVPQIGGGFGQGIVNQQIPVVHFGVPYMEGDGKYSALWLKLFGASSVAVSGAAGRDAYKEAWRDPKKFEGVVPALFRDGDDVIYSVPHRTNSLAHVILRRDIVLRPPINLVDFEPIRALDETLENPAIPLASFTWKTASEAVINAQMTRDQLLFVQVTYHPGWRAVSAGKEVPIQRDGLGLMVIEPQCDGACQVTLTYDGGVEMRVAKLISFIAFGGAFFALWRGRRKAH